MNGLLVAILILTIFNTIFSISVLYYLVNKNCEWCEKEIEAKRVFKLKNLCQECEGKRYRGY